MRTIHTVLPNELDALTDALVTAVRESRPEGERDAYPRHPSALVALAYVALARDFGLNEILTVEIEKAARAHAFRRPGKKKAEPETIPLFADGIDTTPAPAPIATTDVGVWVSEVQVRKHNVLITAEGRMIKQTDDERKAMFDSANQPTGSIAVKRATVPAGHERDLPQVVEASFAGMAGEACKLGWTVRREGRGGFTGMHLIPPGVDLLYQLAPGRTVPALATVPASEDEEDFSMLADSDPPEEEAEPVATPTLREQFDDKFTILHLGQDGVVRGHHSAATVAEEFETVRVSKINVGDRVVLFVGRVDTITKTDWSTEKITLHFGEGEFKKFDTWETVQRIK